MKHSLNHLTSKGARMKKYNFTGIGLIFGTALATLVTIIMSVDIIWALVGTSVGLIIGAIIDANIKK